MKCPNCETENRPQACFCKHCGQPLVQCDSLPAPQVTSPALPASSDVVCPACGATVKSRSRFCSRCGKPLPSAPAPVQAPEQPPAQTHLPPTARMPPRPSSSYPPPTQIAPMPMAPAQMPSPVAPPVPESRPRSSRWVWWVIGVVAFLCIVAVAVFAVLGGFL